MNPTSVYNPERVPFRGTLYVEAVTFDRIAADYSRVSQELEKERVQHAGCLTAAEGHTSEPAKQGDFGWSLAYQKTLELRIAYDALRRASVESVILKKVGREGISAFLWGCACASVTVGALIYLAHR